MTPYAFAISTLLGLHTSIPQRIFARIHWQITTRFYCNFASFYRMSRFCIVNGSCNIAN